MSATAIEVRHSDSNNNPAIQAYMNGTKRMANMSNVTNAVRDFQRIGIEIRFDEFRDEIMLSNTNSGQWRPFKDEDYTRLRIKLEDGGFNAVGLNLIRESVLLVAKENVFDSAITWLNEVAPAWDSKPRISAFLQRYFGAQDTPYVRAASEYLWSALVGRILFPGIKADMVIVLVGEQGTGKSTGVAAICPNIDFFTEISFNEKDDDLSRKMRGHLVGEIGELRGLHTKELESIKAFVTRTREKWIPKFKEFTASYARRIVFIGTTNEAKFLADSTGNRRWVPITVGTVDVVGIRNDCLQLWAEARDTYSGVKYAEVESLLSKVHDDHTIMEPWVDIVEAWLQGTCQPQGVRMVNGYREVVTTSEILKDALGLQPDAMNRKNEMRAAITLKQIGYINGTERINGQRKNVYRYVDTVSSDDTEY